MMRSVARSFLFALLAALIGLLVGCEMFVVPPSPTPEPEGPALDEDKVESKNYLPDPGEDYLPLAVGRWWLYRDASAGHAPTHQATAGVSEEIMGTVVDDAGTELFVLKRHSTDTPDEIRYLHRTPNSLYEYARETEGTLEVFPTRIKILELPLVDEKSLSYRIEDRIYDVRVLFKEPIIMSTGAFQDCWKVEVRERGTSGYEYRWYARGLGVVKIVKESKDFVVSEASLLENVETCLVDLSQNNRSIEATVGERVIVQLPAERETGWSWKLSTLPDESLLLPQGEDHYDDLAERGSFGIPGTFVARFDAIGATESGEPARLEYSYSPVWDAEPAYFFSVRIRISE